MKNEIIKAEDFGIEKKQEKELLADLPQIKKERDVLEAQYSEIIKLDIESPESWKKARELRLLIQKNRTQGINVWHRNAKDYFLKGGQFVDAIKRKEASVNERMESQLLEIEKFEEIQRKKEIERLNELRISEIEPYKEYVPFGINLGELEEEAYIHLLRGAKLQLKEEQERIKKEEEERLKAEKIEKLHSERKDLLIDVWQFVELKNANFGEMEEDEFLKIKSDAEKSKKEYDKEQDRIRKENERLEKERKALEEKARKEEELRSKRAKELQPYIVFIRDYSKLISLNEKEYQKQFEEIKKGAELQWKVDREAEKKEEESRKYIRELERKAKEEEAEKERLRKAPIKEQMTSWINSLDIPNIEIENEVKDDIVEKFNSFKKWALNKIENI